MRFLSTDLVFKTNAGAESDSMAADLTSSGIDIRTVYGCSVQLKYTGSPVGVISLQATCDEIGPTQAQDWVTIAGSTASISSAGDWIYNIDASNYGFIRAFFDFTSGSGTLTGKIVTKGV